ncbi:MAG: sigma-70 family RNA polymerase sigma factor [Spirochaetales bacterium]|nr:sigma-70 family RNA polymerase sigma factor [Spirochaetales bacterium]
MKTEFDLDQLVRENWIRVSSIAFRITNNHEDASEVLQLVFLKLITRWSTIHEPERVASWIALVAKNTAIDFVRCRDRNPPTVFFGEGNTHKLDPELYLRRYCPEASYLQSEKRVMVRDAVERIDRDYRTLIKAFYFGGNSIKQISKESGIPEGTIKWRLSQARQKLKEEISMETTQTRATDSGIVELYCETIWGSNGNDRELQGRTVCASLLSKQILFAIRKAGKNVHQICQEVDAKTVYVEDHLSQMVAADVVTQRNDRFKANCILLDEKDEQAILDSRRPIATSAAQVIADYSEKIDTLFGNLSIADYFSDKNEFRWFFVGLFVLNVGIRRTLIATNRLGSINPPEKPDGGSWYFLPRLKNSAIPVELGCNRDEWLQGKVVSGYARYWNSDYAFVNAGRSKHGIMGVLKSLLSEHPNPVAASTFDESILATAIELGYVTMNDSIVSLSIPAFTGEDGGNIVSLADEISRVITSQPLAAYPDDVYEVFDKIGFGFLKDDYQVRAHNLACPGVMRTLVERKFLTPPEKSRKDSWGVFLWKGDFLPMIEG